MEVLHSKVDTVCLTIGYLQVAGPCCTRADHHGVILSAQLVRVDILAYIGVRHEGLLEPLDIEENTEVCESKPTTPSAAIKSTRRCTIPLSNFMLS